MFETDVMLVPLGGCELVLGGSMAIYSGYHFMEFSRANNEICIWGSESAVKGYTSI